MPVPKPIPSMDMDKHVKMPLTETYKNQGEPLWFLTCVTLFTVKNEVYSLPHLLYMCFLLHVPHLWQWFEFESE